MHPAIPQLVELQRVDQTIAALRTDLEGLPKRLKEADAKLNDARAAVVSAKEAHTQALTQRKKLELDMEQWKERAKKYRAQSSAVKTNEAYKALQQEIAHAEGEASQGEDRVLEQMMALEEVERRLRRAEADLREAEQGVAADKKRIETLYAEQKTKMDTAVAEHAEIEKKIPEELRDLYARIAKKHPGSVMAEARGEQCRGCGMRVLPHTLQLLKSEADEEVFRCEGCGRILYSLEPIPRVHKEATDGAAQS
jgi:predicted  nucleic acid-binding Zn-ribbon protein